MEQPAIIGLSLLCVALLGWVLYQRNWVRTAGEQMRLAREEREAVITLMDNIGERMTSKIDVDETLEVIARYVLEATRAESAVIYLYDETEKQLCARVILGAFPPLVDDDALTSAKSEELNERLRSRPIRLGEGIVSSMLEAREPLLITDPEADPRIPKAAIDNFQIHSLLLSPMRVREKAIGVIAIANKRVEGLFTTRDRALLLALADQAAIAMELVTLYDVLAEQQRLQHELTLAQEFQRMLLPHSLPQVEGYEFSAANEAALVVGGDFYDFFYLDQEHLGVVIGDVSGKGVPGALIMAMVRSILRAEAREMFSPKEVLRRVNEGVRADTKENVFATITYGILNLSNHRFRFARAGHEPTLVRHGDEEREIEEIQPEGVALGLMPADIFDNIEEVEIQLRPGDTVLLYTDGAIEAMNAAADEYGRPRLIELFAKRGHDGTENLVRDIVEDVREFSLGTPQHDDITLVAFRLLPEPPDEADPGTSGIRAIRAAAPERA